jgi:hypothetical protein
MSAPDYAKVLTIIYPGSLWSLVNNDLATLEWDDTNSFPKPTEAELEALWPTVQYEVAYAQVEQARQFAYQQTADPLFFKWQAGTGTKEEWEAERQRIKDAHPYPEDVTNNATN